MSSNSSINVSLFVSSGLEAINISLLRSYGFDLVPSAINISLLRSAVTQLPPVPVSNSHAHAQLQNPIRPPHHPSLRSVV